MRGGLPRLGEGFDIPGHTFRPEYSPGLPKAAHPQEFEIEVLGRGLIRNAGGLVTDDALRSLVISYHLLGTREFFVIEHTGCGMLTFEEEPVKQRIAKATNSDTSALRLSPFKNLEENLRAQAQKIKECPWIPRDVPVYGLIYRVEDGRLRRVV